MVTTDYDLRFSIYLRQLIGKNGKYCLNQINYIQQLVQITVNSRNNINDRAQTTSKYNVLPFCFNFDYEQSFK